MKKRQVTGTRIYSSAFDYSAGRKTFTAEISELHAQGLNPHGRIFYHRQSTVEEQKEGFVMVSTKTGQEAVFTLDYTDKEADGDTRFWVFKPTADELSRNKNLIGVSIVIYND